MRPLLIRDLSILSLTLLLWLLAPSFPLAVLPAAAGATVCAFQFHEWGHFLGGQRVNAVMAPAKVWWSPFLFQFDARANSRQQFLHMSWPGFAATAMFLCVFYLLLPDSHPSTDAIRIAGTCLAALTVIIEVPIALWTVFGGKPPPVPVWLPGAAQKTTDDQPINASEVR